MREGQSTVHRYSTATQLRTGYERNVIAVERGAIATQWRGNEQWLSRQCRRPVDPTRRYWLLACLLQCIVQRMTRRTSSHCAELEQAIVTQRSLIGTMSRRSAFISPARPAETPFLQYSFVSLPWLRVLALFTCSAETEPAFRRVVHHLLLRLPSILKFRGAKNADVICCDLRLK